MIEKLDEREYQLKLAEYIRSLPTLVNNRVAFMEWETGFMEFVIHKCSDSQMERALDLYELHIQNQHAANL